MAKYAGNYDTMLCIGEAMLFRFYGVTRCYNGIIRYTAGTLLKLGGISTRIDKMRTYRDNIRPNVFTTSTDVEAATTHLRVS